MRLKLGLAAFAVAIMVLVLAPALGSASENAPAIAVAAGEACEVLAAGEELGSEGAVQEAKCCKVCPSGTKPCGDTCFKLDKRCPMKGGCACRPAVQDPPDEAI